MKYRVILRETQREFHCQRYLGGSPEWLNEVRISFHPLAPDWQVLLYKKINLRGESWSAESHYLAWSK